MKSFSSRCTATLGRMRKVDKVNWLCSRKFSLTIALPCRHSMCTGSSCVAVHDSGRVNTGEVSIWLRYGNLGEDLVDVNVPIRIRKADTVVKRLQ
ncbi:hypothetical protein GQ600_21613 [Phytophthora cactorum]|nr:hypothetical protein GQ600_21613 [Phytophthora cactorum]